MAKNVLMVSPHLDDAVFSAGGIAATLAAQGMHVVMVTAFTRSVHPASGFALACQRDKGLSDDIDYMALRRAEDVLAAEALGVGQPVWLDLPEAPHRGYDSPAALFAGPHSGDDVAARLTPLLVPLIAAADIVLAPRGLGSHVDHGRVIRAVLDAGVRKIGWWEDTPYVLRVTGARSDEALPAALRSVTIAITEEALARKIKAACAYASQIGFQFGGAVEVAASLAELAIDRGMAGKPGERLLWPSDLPLPEGVSEIS